MMFGRTDPPPLTVRIAVSMYAGAQVTHIGRALNGAPPDLPPGAPIVMQLTRPFPVLHAPRGDAS